MLVCGGLRLGSIFLIGARVWPRLTGLLLKKIGCEPRLERKVRDSSVGESISACSEENSTGVTAEKSHWIVKSIPGCVGRGDVIAFLPIVAAAAADLAVVQTTLVVVSHGPVL